MDREALVKAVIEALEVDETGIGFTSEELAEELGCSRYKALRALRILKQEGRLGVSSKPVVKLNNVTGWVDTYYLKEPDDDRTITDRSTETSDSTGDSTT